MRTLVACLIFRIMFAMIVGVGILLAPAMGRGDALAAVPHHDMQMVEAGHCHSSTSGDRQRGAHRGSPMSCCTAMSVGIAPIVSQLADGPLDQVAPAPVPLAAPHRSFLGETATPPPRSA